MKLTIFLFVLLFSKSFAQKNEFIYSLRSVGQMPSFLIDKSENYFLSETKGYVYSQHKPDKNYFLNQVYNSNMIVYGDSISLYCQELLGKTVNEKINVFLVRNNKTATFSNEKGDIFITTGLISQLSNEAQLLFFLYREYIVIKEGFSTKQDFNKYPEVELNVILKLLYDYPLEIQKTLDKKTWDFMIAETAYSKAEIVLAFDVLFYENASFYEKKVDWNYFNHGYAYVPHAAFMNFVNPEPKLYNPLEEYPDIKSRRDQLISEMSEKGSDATNSETHYQLNKTYFKEIVRLARIESIQINIVNTNFYLALYEIYVMESFDIRSETIDYLKAFSWLGILKERNFEIKRKNYTKYEYSDNEGAFFIKFLRRQTTPALMALGIRTAKDLSDKNPTFKAFEFLYDDIVRLAANAKDFNIDAFKKQPYQENVRLNKLSGKDELDSREVQSKTANIKDSLDAYYLYLIPDLVSDSTFLNKYNTIQKGILNKPLEKTIIEVSSFEISPFKKGEIRTRKKAKLSREDVVFSNPKKNISIINGTSTWDTDAYNRKFKLNTAMMQSYYYSNYSKPIIPLFFEEINSKTNSDFISVLLYRHVYRPQLKSLDFLGLLVIPLPYIVPEYFYSGNKSTFAGFYFDTESGTLVKSIYINFKDPCSKLFLKNTVINTTLNNF